MSRAEELRAAADQLERTGGILYTTTATPAVRELAPRLLGLQTADAVKLLRAEAGGAP